MGFFSILLDRLVVGYRNRGKSEYQYGKCNPSDNDPGLAQRDVNIAHRRMSETPESCHEGPEPPAWPAHISQHDEDRQHDKGHRALAFPPQSIGHMSAVELADGNEVE